MLNRPAYLTPDSLNCGDDSLSTARPAEFWRDPTISYVESRRASQSRACYKLHSHPTFSIGAVDAGGSRFTGTSGGPYNLQLGMMAFIPAGCVHACNPLPDQSRNDQMPHLDATWLRNVVTEMSDIPGGFIKESEIRRLDDEDVYGLFCELNTLLFSNADAEEKMPR